MKLDNIEGLSRAGDVRISDLAAELGLTKGTVSRALNGYEDISKKTRQRVMEAAKKKRLCSFDPGQETGQRANRDHWNGASADAFPAGEHLCQ